MQKSAAPKRDPKGSKDVEPELLVPATIAVMISDAPLANARNVIPANASEMSTSLLKHTELDDELLEAGSEIVLNDDVDGVVEASASVRTVCAAGGAASNRSRALGGHWVVHNMGN